MPKEISNNEKIPVESDEMKAARLFIEGWKKMESPSEAIHPMDTIFNEGRIASYNSGRKATRASKTHQLSEARINFDAEASLKKIK